MKLWETFRKAGDGDCRLMLLLGFSGLLALILIAGLLRTLLHEPGSTNSFAVLADAFMHGRLDVQGCLDTDCARFAEKLYVIFPPFPAIVAMPFVALFGIDFSGFIALSTLFFTISLFLWWRIFERLGTERAGAIWLVLAIAFATPLYYVTIRADGIWFFAQSVNFLMVTLAIHEVLRGGYLVRAGFCLGAAFLCRQMSIFLLPFLFVLALRSDEKLISFRSDYLVKMLKLGLPVAACVGIYLLYNHLRFGDPFETGYTYFTLGQSEAGNWINNRIHEHGLFSSDFFVFNFIYLFVQGLHIEFGGPNMLKILGLDPWGTSLVAASPFVLLAFFAPLRRPVVIGALCAGLIVVLTLFYHGNGYSQYNVQRFVLDWLPVLLYVLGMTVRANLTRPLALLVTYAIGLNVVSMAVLALVASS